MYVCVTHCYFYSNAIYMFSAKINKGDYVHAFYDLFKKKYL